MSVKEKPHYTLAAATLAGWVEGQPEKWWSVDGDPRLTSILDFPCPSDELAPAIRRVGKNLLLHDKNPASTAHGESVAADKLDDLSDTGNRRRKKTLLLSWADSDIDWLLIEDEAMVPG
jgi:hypothetical protein